MYSSTLAPKDISIHKEQTYMSQRQPKHICIVVPVAFCITIMNKAGIYIHDSCEEDNCCHIVLGIPKGYIVTINI